MLGHGHVPFRRRGVWERLVGFFAFDGKRINKRQLKRRSWYAYGYILDKIKISQYFIVEGSNASALRSLWLSRSQLPGIPSRTVMFLGFVQQFDPVVWTSGWDRVVPGETHAPISLHRPFVYRKTYFPGIRKGEMAIMARAFCTDRTTGVSVSCIAILPIVALFFNRSNREHYIKNCKPGEICLIPGIVQKQMFAAALGSMSEKDVAAFRLNAQTRECSLIDASDPSGCAKCGSVHSGWELRFRQCAMDMTRREEHGRPRFFQFFCMHATPPAKMTLCRSVIIRKSASSDGMPVFALIADVSVPSIQAAWLHNVNGKWPSQRMVAELRASKFLNKSPSFVSLRRKIAGEQNMCGNEFGTPRLMRILRNLFQRGYGYVEFSSRA